MSQNPTNQVGQVSADGQFRWDGQQWQPIMPGTREPTSWTRPMQRAAAALFVVEAISSVVIAFAFINHDTMVRAIKAQGTQIPASTTIGQIADFALATTIGFIVFIALLSLVAAVGSYLGWRWMFWVALVLFGLGGIGALTNLTSLFRPETSPIPIAGLIVNELISIANLAMFVWLLVGVIKFGPWAMRKPA